MLAVRRSSFLLSRLAPAAQRGWAVQDLELHSCFFSADAATSSSASTAAAAAPPASAALSAAAAAAAAAPAGAAHSGVTALDGLPLPSWIIAVPKVKRAPVSLQEAIKQVQSLAKANFDETVELHMRLGIDPRRGDQMVRGAATLPHGTGRSVRVCVFARDDAAQQARDAGADVVGGEDLVAGILESGGGGLQFDKCVATPDMMPKLSKIARILGPRGLMPNPKLGTVTANVSGAIKMLKQGRVEFRADKGGVVHAGVGKCSFAPGALLDNAGAFAAAILAARPKGVKGGVVSGYVLSASLCSSMGPGIPVNVANLVSVAQSTAGRKSEG